MADEKQQTETSKEADAKASAEALDKSIAELKILEMAASKPCASDLEKDMSAKVSAYQQMMPESKPLNSNGVHDSVKDTYQNNLLNISTNEDSGSNGSSQYDQYTLSNDTLNWALWMALYNDSWVFRKAIDKPAEDEVNCGISFHNKADVKDIYKDLNDLAPACEEILKWGALFGGSVGFMMFKGLKDEDYAKPIDFHKIQPDAKMFIYTTDRWYGCAQEGVSTVTRMTDPDFGKPRYYSIMFANGKMIKVHHSFILRYEHRNAPKFMKNGMLQGWGYAEGAHILNEIVQNDKLKASVQSLVDKALIEVIKMPGMRGVFMGTDKGNEEQLKKRLEMVVWGRNYNSLTFLDKDDEYSQNQFAGLAGLADLLEQNRWQIAAALDMQGILYGDMKNGMGSDTQAIPSYNKTIKGRCNDYYRPVLQKLCVTLFKKHNIKEVPDFTFNAIYKNEDDASKIDMLVKYEGLLKSLNSDGIITTAQFAESFENYMNNGAISISFTKAEKEVAANKDETNQDPAAAHADAELPEDSTPDTDASSGFGSIETLKPKQQEQATKPAESNEKPAEAPAAPASNEGSK